MKYSCPFCKSPMSYIVEMKKSSSNKPIKPDDPDVILTHKCKKSKCKLGITPKFKIYESQGQLLGTSIILDYNSSIYKIVSWFHLNETILLKVNTEMGFNYSINCTYEDMLRINKAIKIDLADPINSGLSILNRLLNLRAFS